MSALLFRLLLRLYPGDIRARFEADMIDAFNQQLAAGWLDAWVCAVMDLRIAAPFQTRGNAFIVPLLSAVASGVQLVCLIWALNNSNQLLWLSHHLFDN